MSKKRFLGIDGGGTKTTAVLLDDSAIEIARAAGGPSNFHSVGQGVAEGSLRTVIRAVLDTGGLKAKDVTAIGMGMAGVYRPGDSERVRSVLSRIAHFSHVIITHDAEAALIGGVGRRYGVVLISGTGAFAFGVNSGGEARRADGWGYLLGDEGSGYWIGREGLRAVGRAYDGRGPATELQKDILSHLELSDARALVKQVYGDGFGVPEVADLAHVVDEAAERGDAVAESIMRIAGQSLCASVRAVVSGLNMANEAFELVLTGGVLRPRGIAWTTVVSNLNEIAPRARPIKARNDAAVGAALLARQGGK